VRRDSRAEERDEDADVLRVQPDRRDEPSGCFLYACDHNDRLTSTQSGSRARTAGSHSDTTPAPVAGTRTLRVPPASEHKDRIALRNTALDKVAGNKTAKRKGRAIPPPTALNDQRRCLGNGGCVTSLAIVAFTIGC